VSGPPRILLLSPRQPFPPTRGDKLRVFHLARALGRRAEVRVLSFGSEPPGPIEGVRERSVPHNLLPSIVANLATPDPLLPMQARLYLSRAMRAAVRDEIASNRPDVVHVTLARLAPYMSGLPPEVHVHVDFVDALSLNMLTRARGSRFPASAAFALEARLMARYEGRVAARADSASVVSERDRLSSPGLASAAVIPNGVDLEELTFMAPAERAPVALFFGNLGYFHNIEPARQAALEILPRLRRHAPDVSLRIAGARPAPSVMELAGRDGVEVAPDVPSMLAELHRAAVAILPSSSGSGIKNKVLEAFAAGTPVVTNPAGIDGVVGAEPGVHYLEADGPDALAEACAALLENADERVRLAAAARKLVEEDYSWDSRAEALLELYGDQGSRG
jgi:glycosyltransferase involved in cell wall biosynthesis